MQEPRARGTAGKTMEVRWLWPLVAVWAGTGPIDDGEWSAMLEEFRTRDLHRLKLLVLTEGACPSPSQQVQLSRVMGGHLMPLAVVSDSIGVRFVASSVALFIKRIKTFRFDELAAAYTHLGLDAEQRAAAAEFVREMHPASFDGYDAHP